MPSPLNFSPVTFLFLNTMFVGFIFTLTMPPISFNVNFASMIVIVLTVIYRQWMLRQEVTT